MQSILNTKIQAAVRYGMVHGLTPVSPLYIVNEYPKSGGTWVAQMIGRAVSLPFPRNCLPKLESSIMHGHYLRNWGMKNVLVVWRDGRDLMVSWYHHCFFNSEHNLNARVVDEMRSRLKFSDYSDVRANLPVFIEHCFNSCRPMSFSWADFVQKWHGCRHASHVRYEDMRQNGPSELRRVMQDLIGSSLEQKRAADIIDEFSFARQAGRKPGKEHKNSFLRKGIIGDWRTQFTPEACEIFDQYAGKCLIQLGYEQDHSWVKESTVL